MAEHTTFATNDDWRSAGGDVKVSGPRVFRLVVSSDGELKSEILANPALLELGATASLAYHPRLFGASSIVDSGTPGGIFVAVPHARKGSYPYRYENAYVRVFGTKSGFLPAIVIEYKPYALLTLGPDALETVREAVSKRFLAEQRDVKISRLGIATDLQGPWFDPLEGSKVITKARRVRSTGDPKLTSPTFCSPSGGLTFRVYDHTALDPPEEEWLVDTRRRVAPRLKHQHIWRAELTYHRPAIRKLELGEVNTRRASVIETIPTLAGRTAELVSATLDEDDPWVRVVEEPAGSAVPEITDAWWWEEVREAFLEGSRSAARLMLSTTGGNSRPRPGPLGRLTALLSPRRR